MKEQLKSNHSNLIYIYEVFISSQRTSFLALNTINQAKIREFHKKDSCLEYLMSFLNKFVKVSFGWSKCKNENRNSIHFPFYPRIEWFLQFHYSVWNSGINSQEKIFIHILVFGYQWNVNNFLIFSSNTLLSFNDLLIMI